MRIKRGLNLPITGGPEQVIHKGPVIKHVALNGRDFIGLKPRMLVSQGDHVKKGQPLFVDKRSEEIQYVAPGAGVIEAVNRGPKRVLETIVIRLDDSEDEIAFEQAPDPRSLEIDRIKDNLYRSGLWSSFKTRPYSKVPLAADVPHSIFVTAMDSNPLAPRADVIINAQSEAFETGLKAISRLTEGQTFVCHYPDGAPAIGSIPSVSLEPFEGPHPAGLPGTHIHFLDPVTAEKSVWTIGYQDVIAIGKLFQTGKLATERVVALCGPRAAKPRLIETRCGAALVDLLADEIAGDDDCRVVSGSVLSGRIAEKQFAFLGRYDQQVTLMTEDREQDILGWIRPFFRKYSFMNVHPSSFLRRSAKFPFGTNLNGSRRAMVPVGSYERVVPMDILPTQLLRALLILDTDTAQKLGALELDEEDLALCTFVCHSKYEYGEALRASLEKIEKEG